MNISDADIAALRLIFSNMNQSRNVDPSSLGIDKARIRSLKERGFIRSIDFGPVIYINVLADDTVSAFDKREQEAHENAAKDHADKKKADSDKVKEKRQDRRHDYFVAAFSAVIGSLLTLVVEHYDKIIAFIKELLH